MNLYTYRGKKNSTFTSQSCLVLQNLYRLYHDRLWYVIQQCVIWKRWFHFKPILCRSTYSRDASELNDLVEVSGLSGDVHHVPTALHPLLGCGVQLVAPGLEFVETIRIINMVQFIWFMKFNISIGLLYLNLFVIFPINNRPLSYVFKLMDVSSAMPIVMSHYIHLLQ